MMRCFQTPVRKLLTNINMEGRVETLRIIYWYYLDIYLQIQHGRACTGIAYTLSFLKFTYKYKYVRVCRDFVYIHSTSLFLIVAYKRIYQSYKNFAALPFCRFMHTSTSEQDLKQLHVSFIRGSSLTTSGR